MTFTDISNEIQNTLARTDSVVTTNIATWINRRQHMVAGRHNFAYMRVETTQSITVAGGQSYTLPSSWKDDVLFYLSTTSGYVEIPIRSELEMIRKFASTDKAQPQYITLEPGTTTFRIWPPATDITYTLNIAYYRWPADLSGSQTNWLTDNFPQVLVAGGVAEGLWFIGAPQDAGPWEQRYEAYFREAKDHDVQRGMPQESILAPRLNVLSPGMTARQLAGWPW